MNKMKLIELIARHTRGSPAGLETHQFIPSDRLVDLGASSVDRAESAMLVQGSLDLSVPRAELFGPQKTSRTGRFVFAKTKCCLDQSSPG